MRRQRIGMLQTIGIVIALVLGGVSALAAQPIVVTNMVDGEPGSLREAIAGAVSGDTISIEPVGCSPCTIALTLGELVIDKNLSIVGPGPNLLTVSGEGASRVFKILPGVIAELRGFAVRNGNGVGVGDGGYAGSGGGILNQGTLTLLNMIVAGNEALHDGGGMRSFTAGSLTIRNTVFSDNQSGGSGGAMDANRGTIIGSTIAGNAAHFFGGGIYFTEGSLTLVNCTISGNSAQYGAAAFFESHIVHATLTLINTTVTANNATSVTSGGLRGFNATLALNNSIVAGNSPQDMDLVQGSLINNSSRVGGDVTAILNSTLADNGGPTLTHALVPGSPAINGGDTTFLPLDTFDVDGDGNTGEVLPIDQRGAPRVFGGGVDQGAVEVACTPVAVTPTVLSAASVGVAYSQQIAASGGAGPYTLTVTGLPPGLAFDPDTGVLSGTPSTSGTYTVTVTITDGFGCGSTQATYTLTIADPGCGIALGPATLKTPYLATLYYQPLSVTPSGQYTVTVSAGALPHGVYLFAFGHHWFLGGIPTKPGEYTFTLAVKKKNSPCAPTRTYTMTVPATVLPQLTCVVKTGSKYTAKFGYDNSTGEVVTIPVGPDNAFTPGAQDRQQVTTFHTGRVTNAFSVLFTIKQNRSDLAIWYLRGPDGIRRPVNITTATSSCQ